MDGISCPNCGSTNVESSIFQEVIGSKTRTKVKSKYKEGGHKLWWWLTIGWFWVIVDLLLWVFLFAIRLILRLFSTPYKKKKGKGKEISVSKTKTKIKYNTVYLCKNCGNNWSANAMGESISPPSCK